MKKENEKFLFGNMIQKARKLNFVKETFIVKKWIILAFLNG